MELSIANAAKRCPVLSRSGEDSRRKLVPYGKMVIFKRGESLYAQEDPADRCFVLTSGWVKLSRILSNGEEALINVLRQGSTLGFAEGLCNENHRHFATAISDCAALTMPSKILRDIMDEDLSFTQALMHYSFDVTKSLHDQLESLKARSGVERVAGFLLTNMKVENGDIFVDLPYEKYILAAYLGMKPESLSRVFSKLATYGIIATGNRVEISNLEHLKTLAPHVYDA